MAAGGSLFVIGENPGFASRNNTIIAQVSSAGGGTINAFTSAGQPSSPETVLAPFTGPTPLSNIQYLASSASTTRANGRFITVGATGFGTALLFPPGTMTNATAGALIIAFDVNFMQAGADANSQIFIANLIAYLAAPYFTPIPGTPAPASITLVLIGLAAAGIYAVRRKRLNQSLT